MNFYDRAAASFAFEHIVIDHLNQIGWFAEPYGQAQLSRNCRKYLHRFEDDARRPSLIRWMPDVITWRVYDNGRCFVALIDAKGPSPTTNFAIELSAVETSEIYTDRFYTPTFFVFDDTPSWRVLTPREVRQRGRFGPPPDSDRGSGTPYLLVPKMFGRPFETIFVPLTTSPESTVSIPF